MNLVLHGLLPLDTNFTIQWNIQLLETRRTMNINTYHSVKLLSLDLL